MDRLIKSIRTFQAKLGLVFTNSTIEGLYKKHSLEIQRKYLQFYMIFWCIFQFMVIFVLIARPNLIPGGIISRSVMASLSLISIYTSKKLPIVNEITMTVLVCGFYLKQNVGLFSEPWSIITHFTLGNNFGMSILIMLFSIRRLWLQYALIFYFSGVNCWYAGLSTTTFLYVFLLFYFTVQDVQARKDFENLQKNIEGAKRFESLITEHFPTNVVIMSDDLQTKLFSNSQFEKTFEGKHELQLSIFQELQNRLQSNEKSYSRSFSNMQDPLLDSGRKSLASSSGTFAESKFDEKIKDFVIKVQKLRWNDKNAYAIIINDFEVHQNEETMKKMTRFKDRVISSISHELRTPLNGIIGMIDAATEAAENPEDNHNLSTYLANCKSCATLLNHFINSILDVNQLQTEKLKVEKAWISVHEISKELISLYSFQAKSKNLKFDVEIDKNSPKFIFTDKIRLIQVLINLITNAFKFTATGAVTLSIILDSENKGKVKLQVKDTGIGITPTEVPKVFRMFSRMDSIRNTNSQGVGFGLNTSNELVKVLNGDSNETIKVESCVGGGSVFYFFIPYLADDISENDETKVQDILEEEEETEFDLPSFMVTTGAKKMQFPSKLLAARHRSANSNSHTPGKSPNETRSLSFRNDGFVSVKSLIETEEKKKKILVVDDNSFNLVAVKKQIMKLGVEVTTVLSGEQAIQLLLNEKFDLVFMDIQMPILDGIETTKLINEKIEQKLIEKVPIVALTANGEANKESYIEAGMVDLLLKPLEMSKLKEIFNKWVQK